MDETGRARGRVNKRGYEGDAREFVSSFLSSSSLPQDAGCRVEGQCAHDLVCA